jgi:hypothetical protein
MDSKEIFLKCKDLIKSFEFENLAENMINLKSASADSEYIEFLCSSLNTQLEETRDAINIKANSLNKLDEDELKNLKDSINKIKRAKIFLKNYIEKDVALKLNEMEIGKEVSQIIKKLVKASNPKDVIDFSEKLVNRELLCFLIGPEIIKEIDELKINSSLIIDEKFDFITHDEIILENNDLNIQDEERSNQQYKNSVKDTIVNFEKEIKKNNFTKLKNMVLENNESKQRETHDLKNSIFKVLTDSKIQNEESLHNRLVNSILEDGINAINQFKDDISPNKLSSLKTKISKLLPTNSFSSQDLSYALNVLKADLSYDEAELKNIIESVLIILRDSNIENEDNFHSKITVCILKNGLASIETFKDDISPKKYSMLNQKLNSCENIMNYFRKNLVVFEENNFFYELINSIKKYSLEEKITFERFNSLEGFKSSYEEIIKDINNLDGDLKFADALFTLMIYLIKRQQNLKYFIKELKYHIEEKHQIKLSLKELVYNLLLNCEDEVKIKIFQLLYTTNPLPFLNYFSLNNSYQLNFHYESYWITENSTNIKINSFSFDPKSKGKTRLLNKIFSTNFEETIENSVFFNSTMDLQIISNFGTINHNYCLVDTHGVVDFKILDRVANNFDAFIIHVNEDSLNKEMINLIFEFVSKVKSNKIFIFVRDCKKDLRRKDCTNQEMNRKIFVQQFSLIDKNKIKLCRIPNLEKCNEIEDFSRDLRDFIYKEILQIYDTNINKNFLDIYSEKEQEKIKSIKSNASQLIEKLENAIKNDGIKQEGYFSIYPFYFQINLFQNELNKLVYFANNSERCNDLKINLTILKNEMQDYIRNNSIENKLIPFIVINKILTSNDYIFILSFLIKQVNHIFQKQLNEKLKKKETILTKMRQVNIKADSDEYKSLEKDLLVLNSMIDQKRISAEIIWRDLILIYNNNKKLPRIIEEKFREMIFKGQPFEILDGDNFQFNKEFLLDIFYSKQLRIRVISILGPQNSGKSTLLNFMFGCDFSVSDGRCTRGIYGSLIKSSNPKLFDYYLVLDTEGLQSIEKGDKEYDRKLILFCFAVSNILIINSKDQINEDIRQTLEICVDSLSKIEQLKVPRPSVYFVMNQRADPNLKTDQEAINKIISNFTANGLISHLKIDENNFETLPSAFNISITKLNEGKNEIRSFITSSDFSERVCRFTNNVIDQINLIETHDAFSNIYKWLEFSRIIFDTINNYPDLTFFRDIAERIQENELQEYLNKKLLTQLSTQVRDNLFNEINYSTRMLTLDEAEERIRNKISQIRTVLLNDLIDYTKRISVNDTIKNIKKEFIITQLDQFKEAWAQTLKIRIREKNMRHTVCSGEGIINERIKYLLKSGKIYSKKEAEQEFNILFEERSLEIRKNINETIERSDDYVNLIYSIYSAFEKQNIPSKTKIESLMISKKIYFKNPVITSNILLKNALNLKEALNEFKVIDRKNFEKFYDECTLNLLNAIEFIDNIHYYDEYQFHKDLKINFNVKLKPGSYVIKKISLYDLEIDGMHFPIVKTTSESAWNEVKRKIINTVNYLRNKSKKNMYSDEEFSFVIKKFIKDKIIINSEQLNLIFDENRYNEKISEIIKSIKIDSEEEIDHECIQSIILKLDKMFEEYNKDYQFFDLSLSREAKSIAHLSVFKHLVTIYSIKTIEKSENELEIWQKKKESMSKFFVSQLSPDQNKDLENSRQCLRLFSEILEKNFIENSKQKIESKLQEKEDQFTRLKMQANRDSTLNSLNKSDLLSFVLKPTEFLLKDFQTIWIDFENSLNSDITKEFNKTLKQFDNLNDCFQKLHESISKLKKTSETFKVQDLFLISKSTEKLNRSLSSEINNVSHLKGLCACEIVFNLVCLNILKTTFITNDKESPNFELTSEAKVNFEIIHSNMISYDDKELKKILVQLQPELNNISIDYVDLFVQNFLKLIDETKLKFKTKVENYNFEKLGFKKDKYFNRVKGCETNCPCCGRLCDAEHYKVQTEIGSTTNMHKCNRGHQFRGMNGYKIEHLNVPSFKICDTMNDSCLIRSSGKSYKWSEYKKLYPKWNFEADSLENASDWTNKCTYIWSIIGQDLCREFGMKYTPIAVDDNLLKSYDPIHFILVLDDSGSMSGGKWLELIKSVENFLKVRLEEGSNQDLVTIVFFSVGATIEIASSRIYPDLTKQLKPPSFGGETNYSAALERIIQIISSDSQKALKYGKLYIFFLLNLYLFL